VQYDISKLLDFIGSPVPVFLKDRFEKLYLNLEMFCGVVTVEFIWC